MVHLGLREPCEGVIEGWLTCFAKEKEKERTASVLAIDSNALTEGAI